MLGFPTDDGLMGDLFGVKPEDRDAWNQERQRRLERQRKSTPSLGVLNRAASAMYNIGAAGITSQMRAAYIEEQRGTMSKKTETTTTTVTRTQSHNVDPEMDAAQDSPTFGF